MPEACNLSGHIGHDTSPLEWMGIISNTKKSKQVPSICGKLWVTYKKVAINLQTLVVTDLVNGCRVAPVQLVPESTSNAAH